MECRGVDAVGLGWPGLDDGLAFELPPLPRRRVPFHRVDEPIELLVRPSSHISRARGELFEDGLVDAVDLGDPVGDGLPVDAEPFGEFGAKRRVVDRRQRSLVELEGAGVERQPPPIGGADTVGHHDVGVKVRVECSRGVLAERRCDDALGVDDRDFAVDPESGVGVRLDPSDHRSDCRVV